MPVGAPEVSPPVSPVVSGASSLVSPVVSEASSLRVSYNNRMMTDNMMQPLSRINFPAKAKKADSGRIASVHRSKATMDAIKSYILEQRLKPGDPLPTEVQLCEHLGVSRSSVREAIRKLEALDIVRVQQGRGSFVGEMSLNPMVETLVLRYALDHFEGSESLRHVVAIRRYIDLGIASSVVREMKGTSDPNLEQLVVTMIEKAEAGENYLEEDIAFHNGITSYLDNALLDQLVAAMWMVHQSFIPKMEDVIKQDLVKTAKAHALMLETAQAGDVEAYQDAVYKHYEPLANILDLN